MALLRRAQSWLDARGKSAWITALIVALVFMWPLGLALLAYMLWSNRLFSNGKQSAVMMSAVSGNSAFDAYRAETLRRLQDEQDSFEAFLARLRDAKDKAEFDQFMDERSRAPHPQTGDDAA